MHEEEVRGVTRGCVRREGDTCEEDEVGRGWGEGGELRWDGGEIECKERRKVLS